MWSQESSCGLRNLQEQLMEKGRSKNRFSRLFSNGEIGQVPEKLGGRTRARTWDPLIKSQLLYQLSYAPGTCPEKRPPQEGVV